MSQESEQTKQTVPGRRSRRPLAVRLLIGLVKVTVPIVVVASGVWGAKWLMETGPKARQRNVEKHARFVQVTKVHPSQETARIHAMGTVMPTKQIMLQPRVSGEVVKISPSFVPGGTFRQGEFMLQIDPADYELAVKRAESQVTEAEYEYKIEQGRQDIAQREWELLGAEKDASDLDRALALRKPHLERTEAMVSNAEAALAEARLELERTTLKAPFDCMVISEDIDLGAQVTPQTQLATLVGTDEYWVRASIPVSQVSWIDFPQASDAEGSPATVHQQLDAADAQEWAGHVDRLMGELEPQGRMARVLISIENPLASAEGEGVPLILGSYVNVTIEGRPIENVFKLSRTTLREGNRVWVMQGKKLDIREADIVWQNRDYVMVRGGLSAGEKLVVSDIPAPVQGMALVTSDPSSPEGPIEEGVAMSAPNRKEGDRETTR